MEWRSRLACHFLVLGCAALDEDDVDDDIWEEREGRKEGRQEEGTGEEEERSGQMKGVLRAERLH